jgi:hypothetical protein
MIDFFLIILERERKINDKMEENISVILRNYELMRLSLKYCQTFVIMKYN